MTVLYIILGILGALLGAVMLLALFATICALAVNPKKEYSGYSGFYRRLNRWSIWVLEKILRVKVHASGMEKVPAQGRFLVVGNHRSNFDPLITYNVFKKCEIGFISKGSNFKIPFFGRFIRRCCFLPIDRENPRNALKTINKAAQIIIDDQACMAVYPEGTRSKTYELIEFHNGVFRIAQKANVPIVVVAIDGVEKIHKNYIRRRTDVYHDVVDVISAEDVGSMKTDEIGQRVRESLLRHLGK